jgi:hypothetical protein
VRSLRRVTDRQQYNPVLSQCSGYRCPNITATLERINQIFQTLQEGRHTYGLTHLFKVVGKVRHRYHCYLIDLRFP